MSSPSMPYVGSRISLISKSEIRYEGILYVINTEESTIALQNVRSYGTEGRVEPNVPPTDEVYDFIIFRGEDIKDLTVLEGSATKPSQRAVLEDPAVVSVGPERKVAAAPAKGRETNGHRNGAYGGASTATRSYEKKGWDNKDNYNNNRNGYNNKSNWQSNSDNKQGGWNDRRGGNSSGYNRGGYNDHQRGGRKGGYGDNKHRGGPVGELQPNENAQTKAEVTQEFDFSVANEKFEKPAEPTKEVDDVRAGYSKTKSFFDDISCDALERSGDKEGAGRFDRQSREKQREVDKETFGAAALTRPFGYGGRRFQHRGGKGGAQRAF